MAFVSLLFFSVGVALPMLAIILGGRQLVHEASWLKNHTGLIRKALGAIIIVTTLLSVFSNFFINLGFTSMDSSMERALIQKSPDTLVEPLAKPYPAPEFYRTDQWFNSAPLTMEQLKGQVVLVDFWTYSCINCIRTLPPLEALYEKYKKNGFVLIGVHAPEFEFEKDAHNVQDAIKRYGLTYPIVLDSNLATWNRYQNHYWPAHYLINQKGQVVHTHFGEGGYLIMEHNVRTLLGLGAEKEPAGQPKPQEASSPWITPETYLGYSRANTFSSLEAVGPDKETTYTWPPYLQPNAWGLQGKWLVQNERIVSKEAHAKLRLNFQAKKVFLVLGTSNNRAADIIVSLDGQVKQTITVHEHRLYDILSQDSSQQGLLELEFLSPEIEAYAFTFG